MSILFRTFVIQKETNNQLTPKSRKGIDIMKENIVKVLDAINRQGLDNSQWGIVINEISTKEYFGTRFDHKLSNFLYVWLDEGRDEDDIFCHLSPDYFLSIKDEPNQYIIIFKY